jgi:AraC family transcriptional regulator, regulatory protein of adaptative response / methylated-DNA-[protein]-cysteine methyltransferase
LAPRIDARSAEQHSGPCFQIKTYRRRRSTVFSQFESKGRSVSERQAPHADIIERERIVQMMTRATPANDPRETLRYSIGDSALGSVLVASSAKGVASILIGDDRAALIEELQGNFPGAVLQAADDDRLVARVVAMVENPSIGIDLPLDIRGTAFQQKVWAMLRAIPAGATWTYSALASRIGEPKAVRAVASACAANKLAVVIPCHRVVRSNGSPSGYRWGVQRKRALIESEAAPAQTVV